MAMRVEFSAQHTVALLVVASILVTASLPGVTRDTLHATYSSLQEIACPSNGAEVRGLWGFHTSRGVTGVSNQYCNTGVVGCWLHHTGLAVRGVADLVLPKALYHQLGAMVRGTAYIILPEALHKELSGTGYWASKARSSSTIGAWMFKVSSGIWFLFTWSTIHHAFRSLLDITRCLLSITRAAFGLLLAPVWGLVDVLGLLFLGAQAVLGIVRRIRHPGHWQH